MKKIYFTLILGITCAFVNAQTTIISSVVATNPNGSFENATSTFAANGWTTVNNATNQWFVGTAAFNAGAKGAYIGTASGNNNYTNSTSQVSHFYRDVTFPAGETCITLSFNWKGDGESCCDYLKVWCPSTTVTPVAGTQLTTDQLGSTYNVQTTWQSVTLTLPASYAGTTRRLVFSWRNDVSAGNSPAAAVDNIHLVSQVPAIPACASYISPANGATGLCSPATLAWNAVAATCGNAISYDVYLDAGLTASTLVSSAQTGTTYSTGNLLASTTYAWKIVPRNSIGAATGCSTYTFTTGSITSSSVAPFSNNFESCSDWTIVNGSQTNKWVQGNATNNGGTQSMYVSNDGGSTNAYSHTTSTVHFYKDIMFPVGQTCITLGFDWKGQGESTYDYLRVFGVSSTVTPVAGTALSSGQIGSTYYNLSGSWTTVNLTLPAAYAGTTQRIVFSWTNDGGGGTQPPAAVDNIAVTSATVPAPTCATYSLPTNSSTVCPNSVLLSWNTVTASCGSSITYDVYFNAGTSATTLASSSQSAITFNPGLLSPNTVYAWKIVPLNGTVTATGCSTFTFATNSFTSATTAPLTDNFNGTCLDWTVVNGSQTNKWEWGSATGNPAKAMYISNVGVGSNTYNIGSTSIVHFYKDITFPAGQECITLSFDWKGQGESTYDYLRVFGVSTTVSPVAGTALSSGQIGSSYYNLSGAWTTVNLTLPSSYAGTSQRIVFSWTNDGGSGTQPPAAVDNVSITTSVPPTPACATYTTPANGATICPVGTLLAWNTVTSTCGAVVYDVYFDAGSTATTLVSSSQTVTSYNTGALANGTYAWKIVPRIGSVSATGCSTRTFVVSVTTSSVAPFTNNFETCSDWTTVNGSQPNKWFQGTATNNGGSQSMYITNNNGASNAYSNTSSIVHFYKDISFPAGQSCITLSFDWKGVGESGYDDLKVFASSTGVTPVAGTVLSSSLQIGSTYVSQSAWQTVNIILPSSYAGTTQRIIFSWRNDGVTTNQPPAAVDNINITTATPAIPACATYVSPANSSTFCPLPTTLVWNPVVPSCGSIAYDVYFNAGSTATTLVSSAQTGTTYITPSLNASTVYAWKIIPRVGSTIATGCATYTFATNSYTADYTAPLTNNFEGTCNEWTLVNGTQTNQWYWGTATNNGGTKAMYVTNDAGSSNAYSNTSSIVHFYKDVTFPAGLTCITMQFDWRGDGESGYDRMRVYSVASSVTPVAGTLLSSGQIGGPYNSQNNPYITTNITLPATYAGTTRRIVFTWENDGGTRNQPPAAVDNIIINATTPPAPACYTAAIVPTNGGTTPCSGIVNLQWGVPTITGCNAPTGYDLYLGTNNPPTNLYNGVAVGNITNYNSPSLASSTVYYWQVRPTNSGGAATGCTTYSFTTGAVLNPANDEPCNAVDIPVGLIASGDNNCSSNSNEPSTPGCWTSGAVNTVWYSFVAPATGNVKIRTAPGSLRKTQIAVYSGVCGSGMTYVNCNNNAPSCGGTTPDISELSLTGLTSGATYYIAVDGENDNVGNFSIAVIEASLSYPNLAGQNCTSPLPVCAVTFTVGNPGYQGIGFTCDDNGSASDNCTGGERGSVWYTFSTTGAGTLKFNIVPNDYDGSTCGPETDYDFVLWKIAGSTGTITSCANIAVDGGSVSACNYDGNGVTGLANSGNAPSPYPACFDAAYEAPVSFVAGETFVLLVENFSNSTSGFSIDFGGSTTSAVNFVTPTTVVWAGGASNTDWQNSSNWASCSPPNCTRNAVVSPGSAFQPLLTAAMGTVTVQNLTIDPGGILTMGPNSVLQICENLTNNGTLICDPTSTIIFTDDKVTHTMNGTLSGTSRMGNLTIKDVAGSTNCTVKTTTDIELRGNFTTTSATSIFDLNGQNMIIAGNFINSNGANTFSNTAGSTIFFNGTTTQTYSPNTNGATPSLTLNNVTMNHTGTGVNISTTNSPNMILGTSGVLTLNNGKIITPNAQEVQILNTNNTAVSTGNSSSYVEGNLRRYLAANATGGFDFPVGHATPGYERANVDFVTGASTSAIQLLARFDPWGGAWPLPSAPGWGPECGNTYTGNYLDHGYWSIDASSPSTGTYSMTLYNNGYTNSTSGWSIAKSPSSSPNWALDGTCLSSLVTAVQRENMSGFSKFADVQGPPPVILPVELISFNAEALELENEINWKVLSEKNFHHYELQNSDNGIAFTTIYEIEGDAKVNGIKNYSFLDKKFYTPITYYRLKSIDNNGSYRFSSIVSLDRLKVKNSTVKIYPNPAHLEMNILINSSSDQTGKIEIIDVFGSVIYQENINLSQGITNYKINSSNFTKGAYFVKVALDDETVITNKIIVSNKD